MTVTIQPTASRLTDLISYDDSPMLDRKKIEMINWCQAMSAEIWTGRIDGELVSVWGLIPPSLISDRAYLWMFATKRVNDHKFLFVRKSQLVVADMLKRYRVITGHCVAGAESSIRWVRWLGGVFEQSDGRYLPFKIERADG